ncbi:hypothetical protein AX16_010481 [Volvariella volvacea WC 439]|nr:hypothetical protein AX16_010481 [Volvariella volvacea WC 439]
MKLPLPPPPSEESKGPCAIFWDIENMRVPRQRNAFDIACRIRDVALKYGPIQLFKAYDQISAHTSMHVRSGLQAAGVSVTDCPHNGSKEVADKMMITDMSCLASDPAGPKTFVILSDDADYSYTVSTLCSKGKQVILICTDKAKERFRMLASAKLDWTEAVVDKCPPRVAGKPKINAQSSSPSPAAPGATSANAVRVKQRKRKASSELLSGSPPNSTAPTTSNPVAGSGSQALASGINTPPQRNADASATTPSPNGSSAPTAKKARKQGYWREKRERQAARAKDEGAVFTISISTASPSALPPPPPPSIPVPSSVPVPQVPAQPSTEPAHNTIRKEVSVSTVTAPLSIPPHQSPSPTPDAGIFDRLVEIMLELHYEDKITISIADLWERLKPFQQSTYGKLTDAAQAAAGTLSESMKTTQGRELAKKQFKSYIKAAIKADILRTEERSGGVSTVLLSPQWRIASTSA